MAGFACAAAVAIKVPELFGLQLEDFDQFYPRNFSLLVLPFLAGYLTWRRRLKNWALIAVPFAAAAALINAYPFERDLSRSGLLTSGPRWSDTEVLAALHVPILLWLVVGLAHAGGDWRSHDARMRFVRFTGEWLIYYGLIALGGGIFAGSTAGIFAAIGLNVGEFIGLWLVPCGAAGAVVVAAWLAESRQGALERLAPVLTRLFTPLFAAMLIAFLGAMVLTGRGIDVDRGVLIFFDVLLALILALVIYSIAVRDPDAPPGLFDGLQLALVARGSPRRPAGAGRHRLTALRLRNHPQPGSRTGREPGAAGQPCLVCLAVLRLLARPSDLRSSRALADGVRSGLRGVAGGGGGRVPTGVRLRLSPGAPRLRSAPAAPP